MTIDLTPFVRADLFGAFWSDGDYRFKAIKIRGHTATVHFPGGRNWRLELVGGDWLVASFPILPRSLTDGPRALS